jgi:hypothetical protein
MILNSKIVNIGARRGIATRSRSMVPEVSAPWGRLGRKLREGGLDTTGGYVIAISGKFV